MPTITINHPNRLRIIDVYIDDIKVGELDIEECVDFEVTASEHTIVLKSKMRGPNPSIIVDLSDNRDKTITVSSSKRISVIAFGGLFLIITIPTLIKNVFDITSFWYVLAPVFTFTILAVRHLTSKAEALDLKVVD